MGMMELLRTALLILSVFVAWRCAWLFFKSWNKGGDPAPGWLSLCFFGWAVSATFFAWWNFFGRPDYDHDILLIVPNLATIAMITGAKMFAAHMHHDAFFRAAQRIAAAWRVLRAPLGGRAER